MAIQKPNTAMESVTVKRRLKAKYPQMSEKSWGKSGQSWVSRLKTSVRRHMKSKNTKAKDAGRTKQVTSGLKGAGLSDAEIKRLRGGK